MNMEFTDYIRSLLGEKDSKFSHTSRLKPMGIFLINEKNEDEFYSNYNNHIYSGGIAGITEMPQEVIPLIIDVDFKYPLDDGLPRRYYKPSHISSIVNIYQNIIRNMVDDSQLQENDNMLVAFVLEKNSPQVYRDLCKDGFHIHFPFFYTDAKTQKEYIRKRVIETIHNEQILKDIPVSESLETIFDKNIPSVPWFMYGGRKDISAEAYKLSKIYGDSQLLNTTNFLKKVIPKPSNGAPVEWDLPKLLSIRQNFTPTPLKQSVVDEMREKSVIKLVKSAGKKSLELVITDLFISEKLVNMLSVERSNDHRSWMEVGWMLFCISDGHQKGLDQWISFSKKSSKFTEGECERKWNKMESRGYTIKSLKRIAKEDSLEEYKAWNGLQIKYYLQQGLTGTHNDLANILHKLYESQFVCVDCKKDIWYEFRGHRWVQIDNGIDLRKKISAELINYYALFIRDLGDKIQSETDETERENITKKVKMISDLIMKLKSNSFKNSIMKEAVEYFYDEVFITKMDEKKNLIVFNNGVYDSELKEFRNGRPEDYCTKCTNIDYIEYTKHDEIITEMEVMLRKIFTDNKQYKYFIQTTCDIIKGDNKRKLFLIWTGSGDNGKSVVASLLEKTFGDYHFSPPSTLITQKQQQSSGATPELLPAKGSKILVLSETDNNDVLNNGMVKKLTGGDCLYARGLFRDPVQINPSWLSLLHCNKMPGVSSEDQAMWNRLRVVEFTSKFVDSGYPSNEEDQIKEKLFPKDNRLKDNLHIYAQPFAWFLIKAYEKYSGSNIIEPEMVKLATQQYHKANDFYLQFVEENLVKTESDKDIIALNSLYTIFKEWYKESYPGRKSPDKYIFKEGIEKKLGKSTTPKSIWIGYALMD